MGTQSGLLDATTARFSQGITTGLTAWETYVMAVTSLVGLLLIQSAFHAGPLAASLPVLDTVEPVVAVLLGTLLFGEDIRHSLLASGAAGAGIVAVVLGVVLLDTSPVTRAQERRATEDVPDSYAARRRRTAACPP
jgi:drug/metabolite transporter (DMT)-like permease